MIKFVKTIILLANIYILIALIIYIPEIELSFWGTMTALMVFIIILLAAVINVCSLISEFIK